MNGCWRCATSFRGACREHRAEELKARRARALNHHVDWFERTGHCGGCGQPGAYCLCTEKTPCGCRALHEMGSGRDADPAEVFAAPVDDNQGELFTP